MIGVCVQWYIPLFVLRTVFSFVHSMHLAGWLGMCVWVRASIACVFLAHKRSYFSLLRNGVRCRSQFAGRTANNIFEISLRSVYILFHHGQEVGNFVWCLMFRCAHTTFRSCEKKRDFCCCCWLTDWHKECGAFAFEFRDTISGCLYIFFKF